MRRPELERLFAIALIGAVAGLPLIGCRPSDAPRPMTFVFTEASAKLPSSGPKAWCRHPDVIRYILAAMSGTREVKTAGESAVDFEDSTTTAINFADRSASCHGLLRLSNRQANPGTFSIMRNAAADPIWKWDNDPATAPEAEPGEARNAPSSGQPLVENDVVLGRCDYGSHVAEGPVDADLTKMEVPFTCDSVVISFFDKSRQHVMFQFADRKSTVRNIVGFAGYMEPDGITANIDRIYLTDRGRMAVVKGDCEIHFKRPHLDWIVCGARVEDGGRATAPVVIFSALPGQ